LEVVLQITLFFTGRKHAGENLNDLLNEREEGSKVDPNVKTKNSPFLVTLWQALFPFFSPSCSQKGLFQSFPSRKTANTTYKTMQRSRDFFSRGARLSDIVYTIAITAIQGQ